MKITYLQIHPTNRVGMNIPMSEVENGEFFRVGRTDLNYTRQQGRIFCFREFSISMTPSGYVEGNLDLIVEIIERPSRVPPL